MTLRAYLHAEQQRHDAEAQQWKHWLDTREYHLIMADAYAALLHRLAGQPCLDAEAGELPEGEA